jgi:hypothetical protein
VEDVFLALKMDECYGMCHKLLFVPKLPLIHRAMLSLILAVGDWKNYLPLKKIASAYHVLKKQSDNSRKWASNSQATQREAAEKVLLAQKVLKKAKAVRKSHLIETAKRKNEQTSDERRDLLEGD